MIKPVRPCRPHPIIGLSSKDCWPTFPPGWAQKRMIEDVPLSGLSTSTQECLSGYPPGALAGYPQNPEAPSDERGQIRLASGTMNGWTLLPEATASPIVSEIFSPGRSFMGRYERTESGFVGAGRRVYH